MDVLKVVAEGLVTSFRYPHFMLGVQPTFVMPPPATLYGHVASALGEWFDPQGVEFAIHFTYEERFEDIEHTHMMTGSSGKLPGTKWPKVTEGAINPLRRELLFRPKLTLYLNRPDWVDAFRNPRYPVILGRSQDLFTYTGVSTVRLEQSEGAYLEHTLAPFSFSQRTARGVAVLMPKYLDYRQRRKPSFDRYVVLHSRVHASELLCFQGEEPVFWVDPSSAEVKGDRLGLIFHRWVGADE